MKRHGAVIGLRAEKLEEYKRLHEAVWPKVLQQIKDSNIRNYSIYLAQLNGKLYLFSYYEYTGADHAADMAKMAADPTTRDWWKLTDPCQEALPNRAPGEWWSRLEEVFHQD
jgi:L-rhamnose mutarotase